MREVDGREVVFWCGNPQKQILRQNLRQVIYLGADSRKQQ